jgi:hypothetical protein
LQEVDLMTLAFRIFIALTSALSLSAIAAIPTDFVVAPDKASFNPVVPFRTGDRLYVSSQQLDSRDIIALGRCIEPNCANMEIIRAWTPHSRRRSLSAYVNIQQDGDYVFFGSTVPWALPAHESRGCFRSVPLNKVCSEAKRMSIIDAKMAPNVFRVRFSSDSWFWVRRVRAATGA